MKNSVFLGIFSQLLFILLFCVQARSQTTQSMSVAVGVPQQAQVCNQSEIEVRFTNSTGIALTLSPIEISLHDAGPFVTLGQLVGSPDFSVLSGGGTETPVLQYSKKLAPYATAIVRLQVDFSCTLWDNPAQMQQVVTRVNGSYGTVAINSQQQLYAVQSVPYNIGSTEINVGSNLPVAQVSVSEPFSLNIPLEISGNVCDPAFTVMLHQMPACLRYQQAGFSLVRNGVSYPFTPVFQNDASGVFFEVDMTALGLPALCESNYPGGLGELVLKIEQLSVKCGICATDAFYQMQIGFSPCNRATAPKSCLVDGYLPPQSQVIQELYIRPLASAQLSWTETGNQTFSFCQAHNSMTVQLQNTSSEPAYFIDLSFKNFLGYQIVSVQINGFNYPISSNTSVYIDLSGNNLAQYGFQDLNGDQIFEELSPGAAVSMTIFYTRSSTAGCVFGESTACSSPCKPTLLPEQFLEANAQWNNRCNTDGDERQVALAFGGQVPQVWMNVKTNSNSIPDYSTPQTIRVELASGALIGFDDYFNQGPIRRYLCIQAENNAAVSYVSATLNGVALTPGSYIDLGPSTSANFGDAIVEIQFILLNCGIDPEVRFNIGFGFYFENCPDCKIQVACGDARFISPCSGGAGQGNCEAFDNLNICFQNTVYGNNCTGNTMPSPARVYPCDCIHIQIGARVTTGLWSDDVLLGFRVADDELLHFNWNTAFSGTVTAVLPNGTQFDLTLGAPVLNIIPNEPYSIVYLPVNEHHKLTSGTQITANLTLCMQKKFNTGFEQIDYFSPLIGASTPTGIQFCGVGGLPQLYAMEPGFTLQKGITALCSEGGTYSAVMKKTGGELYSPDFPDISRVVASFNLPINVTLDNGSGNFRFLDYEDGCTPVGAPDVFVTPANGFAQIGEEIQRFSFRYEQNCDGSVPLKVSYTIHHRPDAGEPCFQKEDIIEGFNQPTGSFPRIISRPNPVLGTQEYLGSNTGILEILTRNDGGDADEAWVQIEFNPQEVSISTSGVAGPLSAPAVIIDGSCGKKVLILPIAHLANQAEISHQITYRMVEGACNKNVSIEIIGIHRCRCDLFSGYTCATLYSDAGICLDSWQKFLVAPLDANLTLTPAICTAPTIGCFDMTTSMVIENPGEGNLESVSLQIQIPAWLDIISAEYQTGGTNCSSGGIQANIQQLLGAGWQIPGGILFGYGSGQGNLSRRGRLLLKFKSCGTAEAGNTDILLRASGQKPCGQWVIREHQLEGLYDAVFANFSVQLAQAQVTSYTCGNMNGSGQLTLDLANFNGIWPPGADVHFTFNSPNQDLLFNPTTVGVSHPNNPVPSVQVVNTTGDCQFDFDITVRVSPKLTCFVDTCYTWLVFEQYHVEYGGVYPSSVSVPISPCEQPNEINTLVQVQVSINDGITPPFINYEDAVFYCDANNNGVADIGENTLLVVPNGQFNLISGGNPALYQANFSVPTNLLLNCQGGQLLVQFGKAFRYADECICIMPGTYPVCPPRSIPMQQLEQPLIPHAASVRPDTDWAPEVWPNPGSGLFNLKIAAVPGQHIDWQIIDGLGRLVRSNSVEVESQGTPWSGAIDLTTAPSGLYYLLLRSGDMQWQERLIRW